jgi:hypothetical protein
MWLARGLASRSSPAAFSLVMRAWCFREVGVGPNAVPSPAPSHELVRKATL